MRVSKENYYLDIAQTVAERSTCLRKCYGAIIVKDDVIVSTGYNGAPRGIAHCGEREGGCLRMQLGVPSGEKHELCRALHAEQNAIIQAACLGQSIEGSTLYCTTQPCIICAKMLINCGVKKIWIAEGYPDQLSEKMLSEAGVELVVLPAGEGKEGKVRPVEHSSCACGTSCSCGEGGKA